MNTENFKNEKDIRRFLLGEMTDAEENAFEEKFIVDADLFEEARAIEDELIESYVRGLLPASEKEKFERLFLSTTARRERVAFARDMLANFKSKKEKTSEKGRAWQFFSIFFQRPEMALAAAAVVLFAAIFGVWLLWRESSAVNREPQIARKIEPEPNQTSAPPLPATKESPDIDSAGKPESNQTRDNQNNAQILNKNQAEKKLSDQPSRPKPSVPSLALFSGTVRSEGKTNVLNLPRNAAGASLQLNLESVDYETYRAEIVDADGRRVWQSPQKINPRNKKISIFVPAVRLQTGDYLVKLYGQNAEKQDESIADYIFRVNKK